MKRKIFNALALTAVLAVLVCLFAFGALAETWILESPISMEGNSIKADLYNGTLTLKPRSGSGKTTNVKLNEFTMKIPWRDPNVYTTIKEVVFEFGFISLEGIGMCCFNNAEILRIPSSVNSLGRDFGVMMMKLKTVYFGGTQKKWDELSAGITLGGGFQEVEVICESSSGGREYDEQWEIGRYDPETVLASRVGDTLYIEGRGMMQDYKLGSGGKDDLAPWAFNNDIRHVVFCDGVRNVGDYAFFGSNGVEDVTIAGSVTTIGVEGFYGTAITAVVIPASVTTIKESAFNSCNKLATVTLNQNVDTIGDAAFASCPALEKVNYGGSKYYWDRIEMGEGNDAFIKAERVYDYVEEKKPVIGADNPTPQTETEAPVDTERTECPLSVPVIVLGSTTALFAALSIVLAVLFLKKKKA